MAVKCKKCNKEISSSAKFCPNCGELNQKQYCRSCGHEINLAEKFCPSCGNAVNNQTNYNSQPASSTRGEKYEIGLIALICSFLVPIAGIVLGIIAMNANKGLKNDARTMGQIAIIVSTIQTILTVLILVLYFFMFFMSYALY